MTVAVKKTKKAAKATPTPVIGFVGGGNMATALIRGLIEAKIYAGAEILASDVDAAKLRQLQKKHGIHTTTNNAELTRTCNVVVLAVKPQIIDEVLAGMRPAATAEQLFLSIVAGVTTTRLENGLGGRVRVLRSMPNTPALLGKGVSVVARGRFATAADEKLGLKLLKAVGEVVAVPDEKMLDGVTGLSGSGPAYVYRFAEGMIAGGVAAGLPAAIARQLTFQTIAGAAAMLLETGETPETLRAQVTSPGGTTFAGLGELERHGFKDAIVAAIIAATRRSQELGRGKR